MSTVKRESKKIVTAITRDEAETAFAEYNNCIGQLQKLEGSMNLEKTAINEKYEPKISKLQSDKELHYEKLQVFAQENPDLFKDKKSLDFTHGTIGFRTGMPKLITRRGYKWPAVLELVKKFLPTYVKSKEDIDKERLLADRADETVSKRLADVGIEVTQDETFFVTPALDVFSES